MRKRKRNAFFIFLTAAVLTALFTFPATGMDGDNSCDPALKKLWQRCRESLPPLSYRILKDEIVSSDTDPARKLRRIEVRFTSMRVGQWMRRMDHTAVVHIPASPIPPEKNGKVVVVSHRFGDTSMVFNYGEPIAARTGYPTMTIPIPGEYDGHDGESCWMNFFRLRLINTSDPIDHRYFRLAVPYIRALDVFAGILDLKPDEIRAVIGGHSKRAPSAFNAAAMDPLRVEGVVYMGMESTFESYEGKVYQPISPVYSQSEVRCPVLYIGATNEDGYEMFNINKIQGRMKKPWTIEMIPNYRHAAGSEVHIMDWMMWTAHIFERRPITKIRELRFEEDAEGTFFRACIDTPNKIIKSQVWYVYCDDIPYWRDLMWYPASLRKKGDFYEAYVLGKLPDAWMVEVKDVAGGFPGYVSSLPQDITHKPTKERYSRGSRSRHWEKKKK